MNFFCWDEVARRVAKAKDAANQAAADCNVARSHATGVLHAGNDHVAALDACIRCDAASLAAMEVAARYEEVAANDRPGPVVPSPAENARVAAALCDVEGAKAASQAANGFADICEAACGGVEAPTLAAREAAERCALARDHEETALLVAREAVTRRDVAKAVLVAHRKVFEECVDSHTEAREDAAAAAFAAREAAVRCDSARRGAVSAASVARKIASRCEAAGGDGAAVAAAAAARHAADRCVAARAAVVVASTDGDEAATGEAVPTPADEDIFVASEAMQPPPDEAAVGEVAPHPDEAQGGNDVAEAIAAEVALPAASADPVVPRADAEASKAREAAASCDAALADPVADADNEYLDKMRGWLMTVAALFVGIAFQAILHPPGGMSIDSCNILGKSAWKKGSGAPSPAPAPAPSSEATAVNVMSPSDWPGACLYLTFNTITMAIALRMVLVLVS